MYGDMVVGQRAHGKEQTCPQCGVVVPVHSGFVTWCDQCGWNLAPQEQGQPQNVFERVYASLGRRQGQAIAQQQLRTKPRRPPFRASLLLASVLAALVHASTLGLVPVGVVLIVATWPNIIAIFLGLVCFGAAWLLRPRFPEFPERVLARGEYPAFYEIVDTIAAAYGARAVNAIALSGGFNAAFFQASWRQRRVLVVGLPLWEILGGQEKVALVAHELAHGVNGDPARSMFVGGALYTLTTWHMLLRPASLREGPPAVNPILRLLSNVTMLALSVIPWLGAYLMAHLLWRDSQRAEYLADYLAASTSGTEAMLGLLEKLHLERTFEVSLQRIALSQDQNQDLFEALRERMASVPDRELERIRRVEQMAGSRLDATHPPTALRIQVLRAHPVSAPSVKLRLPLFEQLDSELDAARQETQRKLIDMRQSWLYYR